MQTSDRYILQGERISAKLQNGPQESEIEII